MNYVTYICSLKMTAMEKNQSHPTSPLLLSYFFHPSFPKYLLESYTKATSKKWEEFLGLISSYRTKLMQGKENTQQKLWDNLNEKKVKYKLCILFTLHSHKHRLQ